MWGKKFVKLHRTLQYGIRLANWISHSVTAECCLTEQTISRPCNKQNANYNTQDTHRTSAIHVRNNDSKERGLVMGQ